MDDDSDFSIPVYISKCGYFENRTNEYFITSITSPIEPMLVFPEHITSLEELALDDEQKLSILLAKADYLFSIGFRRSGDLFYLNLCQECSDCIPIRVPVKDFEITKKYRRILKNNSDIRIECVKSEITDEKIKLFQKYNSLRHDNDGDCFSHLSSLHTGYDGICEMDYFIDNKLIAVGILDLGSDCTSSNYFYFDPDYSKRSLGVFSVLKEIEFTRQSGKEFYYLGFYLENSPKMRYKSQYQPAQLYINQEWTDFDKTDFTVYKSSDKENK